ncbi:AB hydrolase superfamily protein C1039.03 [Rhizoctonia solani AG-1 IB]|uniref:AB hydrolase superfamily protein C1039.03 n=1 Tax=Thanatephorus cucumeris (strain AG1-IB / isolate 7/3/14) TaxID=1108050 RepID=M5CA70_THACB|nr:AB hydrolase superfamily protein C1039.03 [Rhizoctonia solani AG-1 IB]
MDMIDPPTFNNPIHPDVAPYLDAEYAVFHNKHLADRPGIYKLPWNPTCRVGSANPGELDPCDVSSVRDLTIPGTPPVKVRVFVPPGEKPEAAKCIVISVDYRLAPEHVFPAAVDDCWTTIEWIYKHGSVELGINSLNIAVGGSSA